MTYQIVSERKRKNNPGVIRRPKDAYDLVKHYGNAEKEHFLLITLNGNHEPISVSIVSIGLVNRTIVHPREVFSRAVRDMATAIIVCHNHPSGSLEPSNEDKEVTEMIYEAGEVLRIRVLDHIIFSQFGFASLQAEGYLKARDVEDTPLC